MYFREIIKEDTDNVMGVKRIFNTIQKHFINKLENKPTKLFPFDSSDPDKIINIYIPLYNFINEFVTSNHSDVMVIFNTFIVKYNPEGNYENLENVVDLPENVLSSMFSPKVMILSKYFRTSPFLIYKEQYTNYGMPIYWIEDEESHFSIGDLSEIKNACYEYVKDRYYDLSEVRDVFGDETVLNFSYVNDRFIPTLSRESADQRLDSMGIGGMLNFLLDYDSEESIKLLTRYQNILDKSKEDVENNYKGLLDDLIEEITEYIFEILSEEYEDMITNDITEFLNELGYLDTEGGYYKISKIPNWLEFEWEEFYDEQASEMDYHYLSPYERLDIYKGESSNYYILKVDY